MRLIQLQANAFSSGWGNTIFQTANEMAANSVVRKKVEEIQAQAKAEREWWDEKRANIKTEFLKELDGGSETKKSSLIPERPGSEDDAVLVEAGKSEPSGKGSTKKKKGKR